MLLMVTGGSMMPRTQEPSHGAGQTRPVNSGKLLVLWRRSSGPPARAPGRRGSFHSGIRLWIGAAGGHPALITSPVWQKGDAAVHAAGSLALQRGIGQMLVELPARFRSARLESGPEAAPRSYSMKPVGLPIWRPLHPSCPGDPYLPSARALSRALTLGTPP